jgi:hypothetical protein
VGNHYIPNVEGELMGVAIFLSFVLPLFLPSVARPPFGPASCTRPATTRSQRQWFFILFFLGASQISLQRLPSQILAA